ncbi:hypothetical protein NEISICOT_01539 [Neisseria sicca ATCC 29256]|uniref:Uncharacterized protein n=1 Tax=Neisseria sicca ATCC 29256 TaxID=547045 RepID=C6M4U0_NEISI|nr:hypothetical protein NEISICOT_01539 [Neisseria sicca ATCC 29256]
MQPDRFRRPRATVSIRRIAFQTVRRIKKISRQAAEHPEKIPKQVEPSRLPIILLIYSFGSL